MTAKVKSHHKLTITERRAKVADCLINRKMTLREAAAECGCALGTVSADFNAMRGEWAKTAADLVDLERRRTLADLDKLMGKCWSALSPEIDIDAVGLTAGQAASTIVRALELKARVLGLFDEPTASTSIRQVVLLPPREPLIGGCGLKKIHGGPDE